MNRVILIGRLTRDPELRYTQSNQAVATFTLAVDRKMSKEKKQEAESQNRQTADFIRITVWGQPGEIASKYLRKGSQCAIEGRIQTGSYQDQQTGKTIYTTDVVADSVEFIGSRADSGANYNNNNNYREDNQDFGNNDYSQTNQYQGNNYKQNNNNQNQGGFDSNDDFFDDDFTEIEDDGRIPF